MTKQKKRKSRFFMTLAFMLATLFAVTMNASASDGQVTVANKTAKANDSITIPVTLSGNPGIAGFEFLISYDQSVLELTGATAKDFPGTQFSKNLSALPYKCSWMSASQENVTTNGAICELTFKVKGGVPETTISVSYTEGLVFGTKDQRMYNVNPSITNGVVTINDNPPPVDGGRVTVGNRTTQAGKSVTIPVTLSENPGVAGFEFQFSYDKNVLELTGSTGGDFSGVQFSKNLTTMPYKCSWMSASQENVTTNGTVCELTFKVKENISPQTATISVNYAEGLVFGTKDQQIYNVNPQKTDGAITIEEVEKPKPINAGRVAIENRTAQAGQSVTVPVTLSENPGIAGFEFQLSYDKNVLELTGSTGGDFSGVQFSKNLTTMPYKCSWMSASQENVTTNGTVCELTFKVKDTASAPGTSKISVNYDAGLVFGTKDQQIYDVNPSKTDGVVTIEKKEKPNPVNAGRVTVESQTVQPGQSVTVPVLLSENPGVSGFEFQFSYDKNVLELTGATGKDFSGVQFSKNLTTMPYKCSWISASQENVAINGTICELTFKVKENASGTSTITVNYETGLVFGTKDQQLYNVNPQKTDGILTFSVKTYSVTAGSASNGAVSADKTKASQGETVNVTATPNSGYMVEKVTYTPKGGSTTDITNSLKFTMPAADVTVNAIFVLIPPKTYQVTVGNAENGTVSVDKSSNLQAGTTVNVTATPNSGYMVEKVTYTPKGGSATDITNSLKFTMPAADVTVNETFNKTYQVTVGNTENGKASVDKSSGLKRNDIVTVTATPNDGYEVDKITYTPKGGSATDITNSLKFTMPAADVTVNVSFRPKTYSVTVSPVFNGKASVSKQTGWKKGDSVTVDVKPDEGYEVEKIAWTPRGGSSSDITKGKSFVMPDADVIVEVTFTPRPYDVTVKTGNNGSASVAQKTDKLTLKMGDAVIVTDTPDEGYELDKITWTPDGGSATDITSTKVFNMPAANVTVNVTFRPKSYSVTVVSGENGEAFVSKKDGWNKGNEVEVSVKPKDGYEVEKITWTQTGGSANDITASSKFTMPAADVTVNVTFRQSVYSVTVTSGSNGTAAVSKKDGCHKDDEIKVTATPSNGYEVEKITWAPTGGKETDITELKTFKMPAANVTVNVTFRQIPVKTYTVTLSDMSNGTASVSRTKGVEGDQVSITNIKASDGYTLDKITWTPEGGAATDITESKSFKIPAKNVTVKVTFKTAPTYTVTFNPNGGSGSASTAKTATTGKLTALPSPSPTRSGYSFDGWYTSAGGGTKISTSTVFTKDTTVYAHWNKNTTYAISVPSSITGGAVTPNASSAASGETVTLTVSAQGGYELDTLTVKRDSGSSVQTSSNGSLYTFTMPAEKVTVSAAFKRTVSPSYFITWTAQHGRFTDYSASGVPGTRITVNAVPDDGYRIGKITWKQDGGVERDITSEKSFTMPSANVTVTASFVAITPTNLDGSEFNPERDIFPDNVFGKYFHDPVVWAVGKGITNGTTASTFSPDAPCTRGQVVTFLWRAAGQPTPSSMANPFIDVSPGPFYSAILWAVEMGITNGTTETTFEPQSTVTRGQAVTFLYRSARQTPSAGYNPFSDISPSNYYYNAVLWANQNNVTNGTTSTTFSPNQACTRGHIVTFLYRHMT